MVGGSWGPVEGTRAHRKASPCPCSSPCPALLPLSTQCGASPDPFSCWHQLVAEAAAPEGRERSMSFLMQGPSEQIRPQVLLAGSTRREDFCTWVKAASLCPVRSQLSLSPTKLGLSRSAHPTVTSKPLSSVRSSQAGEGSPPQRDLPPCPCTPGCPLALLPFPWHSVSASGTYFAGRREAPSPGSPAVICPSSLR